MNLVKKINNPCKKQGVDKSHHVYCIIYIYTIYTYIISGFDPMDGYVF